jgi:hypothetical protein
MAERAFHPSLKATSPPDMVTLDPITEPVAPPAESDAVPSLKL